MDQSPAEHLAIVYRLSWGPVLQSAPTATALVEMVPIGRSRLRKLAPLYGRGQYRLGSGRY
jgi:hypothetical protein